MEKKRRVRLTINGVVCGVITAESGEYMQALADEVGGLMTEVQGASPLITRESAALTAALSLCDDFHKSADRAQHLQERVDELEVEAELWQEEKAELLKNALDAQKDAQLAEKAARLEAENTVLEEAVQRLKGADARAQALEDENTALREAAQRQPVGNPEREAQLAQENTSLKERLRQVVEFTKQNQEALQSAEEQAAEAQALRQKVEELTAQAQQGREALQSAEGQAAEAQALRQKVEELTASLQKASGRDREAEDLEQQLSELNVELRRARAAAKLAQEQQNEMENLREQVRVLTRESAQTREALETAQEALARSRTEEAPAIKKEPRREKPRREERRQEEPASQDQEPEAPWSPKPGRKRRNPLRYEEDLGQSGMVSFFEKDE